MNIPIILAFVLYFSILLLIGFVSHRRSETETDFVLGDRSVNFWLTAISAHASDMSAWLFMSVPAALFIGGVSQAWLGIGLVFGMFLNWQFIAKKLRQRTEESDSYTLSTFFERCFNDSTGVLRFLTALMTVVFLSCYLSAGLIAMGYLFQSIFGINYFIGVVVATAAVITYTLFGGFVAVAWIDFFQGMFLLFVILLVPLFAISHLGGIGSVVDQFAQYGRSTSLIPNGSWISLITGLLLSFGWGLGYLGQPHIITKFMGVNSSEDLKKSKYLGMSWQILALFGAISIGLIGIVFFQGELNNPELVFVDIVKALFHPFIAGIVLCGVIAANISTMDSQILVCASVITEDIYKLLVGENASSSQLLKISRYSVVGVTLASLFVAMSQNVTVMQTVFFSWSGLGCTFGPLVVTSLYGKDINKYGAYAGIVVGGLVPFIWPFVNIYVTSVLIPSLVIGFPLGLLTVVTVSRFTHVKI